MDDDAGMRRGWTRAMRCMTEPVRERVAVTQETAVKRIAHAERLHGDGSFIQEHFGF